MENKSETETTCHDLRELGVIDEKMLYSAIIEQGPKGEEGRLFKQQEIVYEEVTNLRLEFLDILKIDHLWMLTGLRKLQLSNNYLEKIENLNALTNLEELDLSFNFIECIENLETLKKLKVLTLFQNKIGVLENLESLNNLTIFSVGNNKIIDYKNVIYLRKLENLKSLNMSGNPICGDDNFKKFIMAYLPQLVYYEYQRISNKEREKARDFFLKNLVKLERVEKEEKDLLMVKKREEDQEVMNEEAFVGNIGRNKLFSNLFEKDVDCKTLLQMGDSVLEIHNEFKKNFAEVTEELLAFSINQMELRKNEISKFEKFFGNAKKHAFEESRCIVENFLEQRNELFGQIKDILSTDVEDDETANEVSYNVQVTSEAFKDLCHRTWTMLMEKELNLFEGTDEVHGMYERTMTELVNQFTEGVQAHFTQLRQLQGVFNEAITDAANKFFTHYTVSTTSGSTTEYKNLPADLLFMMKDKEILLNALSSSHDYHLLIIDQQEDKVVSSVKNWLLNLIDNLYGLEKNRHRGTIMEINHFLDVQKAELQEILSTPVGLLLLPKEIQDALQI